MALNSDLKGKLALTTAVLAFFAGYGRRSYAGSCTPSSGATIVCSGPANSATDLTQTVTITGNGTLTTNSGFGIDTSTQSGIALYSRGSGTIDLVASSTIVGKYNGFYARNNGTGALTITAAGEVKAVGTSGVALMATNLATATNLTLTTAVGSTITGNLHGIRAANYGAGITTVTLNGDVASTQTNGTAVIVQNSAPSSDIIITTGSDSSITGVGSGIGASNGGIGSMSITANGYVKGTNGNGISAIGAPTAKGLTVTTGADSSVTGGRYGIFLKSYGTDDATITTNGDVTGTGTTSAGIWAAVSSFTPGTDTDLTITTNAGSVVTGGRFGISANNLAEGSIAVTVNDDVSATASDGIGIMAGNGTLGRDIKVTTSAGTAVTGVSQGIFAANAGLGATDVVADGDVSATGAYGIGIRVFAGPTAADVNVATGIDSTVSGNNAAISTSNLGTGATNINVDGTVNSARGDGIVALNLGSGVKEILITMGKDSSVNANVNGILAVNYGTSTTSIDVSGDVAGMTGHGIGISSMGQAGPVNVSVQSGGLVEGGMDGIYAFSSKASQTISITNAGTIRNVSNASDDLAIKTTGGPTDIANSGLVTGTVILSALDDSFSNTGTWNTANGANDFGAGTDHVDNRGTVIAAASAGTAETTSFDGLETFTNGGLLTMRDGGTGDVTRTSGDYVGDGGVMAMDTYLGTDGSPTDLWVINGDASGSTTLSIANAGGPGALTTKDGIKVVQVDGNSTSDAFRLARTLTAGAYDYNLFYGGVTDPGDQDWYLRSVGASASTQTALPYADTLVNYAEATLGTLQQRTGNRVWPNGTPPEAIWCKDPSRNFRCTPTGEQNASYADGKPVLYGQGAWGRIGGQYASYDPRTGSAYTQSLGFLQAGYEGVAHENGSGELTLGAFATIGTSRAEIDVSPDPVTKAARSGKITSTGYGLGGNLTWLGQDGFYADAVGQFTWYESDLSNKAGGGNSGWSSVLSLEAGRRFELGSGWALAPQAQLAWAHVDFDSFTDLNGARVALGDGDSLKGRLGLRVENLASWKNQQGRTDRLQLYAIANLSYQFLDGTSVEVAGSSFTQQNKRLWGEVGLGGSYAWNDEWSLYGEADYAAALSSGSGDNYALKGTAGLRYRW
ncbi:hypothetical protein LMIY3S_04719 [Labrys miyagiensis]